MKYLFILFFITVLSTFGFAQNLTVDNSNIIISSDSLVNFGDITLTNPSTTETVEIAFRLERECLNVGDATMIQICIDLLCFPAVNETTVWGQDAGTAFLILGPGESNNKFSFKSLPQGDYESEWNLAFYDRNNPSNETMVNIKIEGDDLLDCSTPVSTTDFNYQIGKAYPNPALEVINIPYQIDVNEANLNIYTSTGTLVKTVAVSPQAEQVEVNVADFVSGVYFYNITDGKEQSKMMSFVK